MYALTDLLLNVKDVAQYLRGISTGNVFEEMFAYQLYQKFCGDGCLLNKVFDFQEKPPSRANETTCLASVYHTSAESADMKSHDLTAVPTSVLAFQAKAAQDDLRWARDPNGILFLFPEKSAGPDVVGLFQRSDKSKLFIFCQNKLVQNNVNLADASIQSYFFATKVAPLII